MAQKKESNLPAWDLSDLYNGIDDPKINKDLEKIRKLNLKLAKDYTHKARLLKLLGRHLFFHNLKQGF